MRALSGRRVGGQGSGGGRRRPRGSSARRQVDHQRRCARADAYAAAGDSVLHVPRGPSAYNDPAEPTEPKRVQRGGSFLCSDEYCSRYMVGTRGKGEVRTASNHVGFRCVKD